MNYIYSDGELRGDVFVGKLGTTQDYAWLYEGIENIEALSDEAAHEYVEMHAGIIYDMYTAECGEADVTALSFENFLKESDFDEAVYAVIKAREDRKAEIELENVMTVVEVADEFKVSEDTVRKACQRYQTPGGIRCRQSGSTYLLLRRDAEKRWGKK